MKFSLVIEFSFLKRSSILTRSIGINVRRLSESTIIRRINMKGATARTHVTTVTAYRIRTRWAKPFVKKHIFDLLGSFSLKRVEAPSCGKFGRKF